MNQQDKEKAMQAAAKSIQIADHFTEYLNNQHVAIFDAVMAAGLLAARTIYASGKDHEEQARNAVVGAMEAGLKDLHIATEVTDAMAEAEGATRQ